MKSQLILFTVVVIAGCSKSAPQPTATPESNVAVKQPTASESSPSESAKEDAPSDNTRRSLGPISFTPPPGWEIREAAQAEELVMFAPERPEWREIGFRANLGVRKRPHPGVSLDRFRELLDQTLAKSAEQVNATLQQHLETVSNGNRPDIQLSQKGQYTLDETTIDSVRVLSTRFAGVFALPRGPVGTETLGLQILRSDALYSITLTFPDKFKEEMTPVWKSFAESVHVEQE